MAHKVGTQCSKTEFSICAVSFTVCFLDINSRKDFASILYHFNTLGILCNLTSASTSRIYSSIFYSKQTSLETLLSVNIVILNCLQSYGLVAGKHDAIV